MKNILIINEEFLSMKLERYYNYKLPFKTWDARKFDDALNIYNSNDIDIVILDFNSSENKKVLDEIMKINNEQKIIILSDKLAYSEDKGCEFCIENNSRKRLAKPYEIIEVAETIEHFDNKACKYFNALSSIEKFIPTIMKRYMNFNYDSITRRISLNKRITNTSHNTIEIVDIINNLNHFNIKYKMIDSTTIELTNKK